MSPLDYLLRAIAGSVAGAVVYFVLRYVSFFEASQNIAIGSAVAAFVLIVLFGQKMFRFVMEMVETIW